jgi:hypothetical protein
MQFSHIFEEFKNEGAFNFAAKSLILPPDNWAPFWKGVEAIFVFFGKRAKRKKKRENEHAYYRMNVKVSVLCSCYALLGNFQLREIKTRLCGTTSASYSAKKRKKSMHEAHT